MKPAPSFGPRPRLQPYWDARAAANFMLGGAGAGLVVWSALGAVSVPGLTVGVLAVLLGLAAVWAEIGRPWRALNVFLRPRGSWMSREAIAAVLLLAAALPALLLGAAWAVGAAALAALGFVYCQARILHAAKGIPAWREPLVVPLIVVTALAEGGGAWLLIEAWRSAAPVWAWAAIAVLLLTRLALGAAWRKRLQTTRAALACIDAALRIGQAATLAALAALLIAATASVGDGGVRLLQSMAGALALGSGAWFKFVLVTRAAYTQGFTLPQLPVRGVPRRQGG